MFNPLLYLLSSTVGYHWLPVWVSVSYTRNTAQNSLEVRWKLSTSQVLSETMIVKIYHSSTSNGQREEWDWEIFAGSSYAEGLYYYPLSNLAGVSELKFGLRSGVGYSIPSTGARPQEVRVPVAASAPTTPTVPQGELPPAPDPTTITWSSAYVPQTEEIVNGVLEITGQSFRSLNGNPVVDLRQIPDDTLILAHHNYTQGGGPIFFSEYKRHKFRAWSNYAYNLPYQDTTNWGNWFWCGANPKEIVIENNYMEGRGVQLELTNQSAANQLQGFTFRRNVIKNIHGKLDSFLSSKTSVVNVQGNDVEVGGVLVEWNQVINAENESHTEDLMNFYRVRSKASSPITVRHNFLNGAYYNDVNRKNGDGIFSGGGIIFEMSQGAKVYGNLLVNLKNYCIGLAATNDMEVYQNKCIVASIHADGNYFNTGSSGLWSSYFYAGNWGNNNVFHDNEVGIRNTYGSLNTADHEHMEIGVTDGSATAVNNLTWESKGMFPTKATEEALYTEWKQKLATNNISLGPVL